ncbi:MAG: hypothetical protein JWR62_2666 [Modestobacter sp.]|jgi:hypothetical protein|nr:hypothetical protein [Modestobacter sp.]HEV7870077.1 hypothetical protein [Modestobacter sp.]
MWALTVWALLASAGVIALSAKLWWHVELRETDSLDFESWRRGLRIG